MAISKKRALAIFKTLRVKDPEAWADAESEYPSLARFLFLKAVWSNVIGDDSSWMDEWANKRDPIPSAIQRMLAKGIDPSDLTDVVRDMQIDALFNLCVSLDDCAVGIEELQERIPENVEWRLCEFDGEKERVGRPMHDLHSDFYDFDPTGRRGAPRKRATKKKRRDR